MHFHIVTLFPEAFDSYFETSIIGRAIADKKIKVSFYNPRNFVLDKNKRIDQKPYGGGPGMVIQALPVIKAVAKAKGRKKNVKIFFLSPGGEQFDTAKASQIEKAHKDIILICGRYEGIDERVNEVFETEKISVGPFTLTGGEIGAMIMVDVISRQVNGVLGNADSPEERRIASNKVYTRPEIIKYKNKKYSVPKVLVEGHHAKINEWKKS